MAKSKDQLHTAFASYQLLKTIGEGGAGLVWEARDNSGKGFAVKILKPESSTGERRKRFQNEITFCETVKHPNIVRVLDRGVISGDKAVTPFFVMPLYSSSFRKVMQAKTSPDALLRNFDQLLSGVEAAHLQGVTHRDLKPENVLYDQAANVVLVADFGIAHFTDEEIYTAVNTADSSRLANFVYAAPEQRVRGGRVDVRTDIYSLGLILNELFTGAVPHGMGYSQVGSVIPQYEWIDEIVGAMIQTDPGRRPQSIDAVKRLFMAQKQDYVTRQRLSELKNIVVPVGDEDDPLALEPPQVVGVEWKAGSLTLLLDRAVNDGWIHALHNMGSFSYIMGIRPQSFNFTGKRAVVAVRDTEAQSVINHFKEWLPNATRTYRNNRDSQRRRAADEERRRLEHERTELERQKRVNASLRI